MTNKEYKARREEHETANELYTFEKWNGYSLYPSRMMDSTELKEMRQDRKAEKGNGAFTLDGFGVRAVVIPVDGGYILKSYNTEVAAFVNGSFNKLWAGYSVTTMKHINTFRAWLGIPTMNKKEWIEAPTAAEIVDNETGVVVYAA